MKTYNKRMVALLISFLVLLNTCSAGIMASAEEIVNFIQNYASNANYYSSGSDWYSSSSDSYVSDTDSGIIYDVYSVYSSATDFTYDVSWSFDFSNNTLTVEGNGYIGGYYDYAWRDFRDRIEKVIISEGITDIGYERFYYHENLKEIVLPKSLVSIGSQAFYGCYNLEKVIFNGTYSEWNNIYISSSNTNLLNAKIIYSCDCGGKFSDFVVTKEADCITYGQETSFCDTCNTKIVRNLSLGEHNFVDRECTICKMVGYVIETPHPDNEGGTWKIYEPNYSKIKLKFSNETYLGYYLRIYYNWHSYDGYWSYNTYYYSELKGRTLTYNYNNIELVYNPYYSGYYGFKVDVILQDPKVSVDSSEYYDYVVNDYNGEKYVEITKYIGDETKVVVPDYIEGIPVKKIGNMAFEGCNKITKITLPDSVTSIGNSAFSDCQKLANINIPSGVSYIGDYAFYYCKKLTNITIPDGVTSIGDYTFSDCTSLTGITIPDSVTSIGISAFHDCKNLANINIPSGVSYIGGYAFRYCVSLTSITIPDGVTSIGDYTFSDCTSLTGITIPDSVTSIGKGAFYRCNSLKKITLPFIGSDIDETKSSNFGYIFGSDYYSYNDSYVPSSLREVVITKDTNVGDEAFYDCIYIRKIVLPNTVTSIGYYAFYNCRNLTDITFSDNINYIEDNAFYNTPILTSTNKWENGMFYVGKILYKVKNNLSGDAIIKDGTKMISAYAFEDCKSLTNIVVPNSVESIGRGAFRDCDSLQKITLPFIGSDIDGTENSSFGYIFYYSDYYGEDYYFNNYVPSSLKEVIITNDNAVANNAFRNCEHIEKIVLSDTVKNIGDYAFYNCISLSEFEASNSIEFIGDSAFYNTAIYNSKDNREDGCLYIGSFLISCDNSKIGKYVVKEGTTVISESAFSNCDNLAWIVLPESLKTIGYEAFSECSNLTRINIPASVEYIYEYAFEGCSSLKRVDITDISAWCNIEFSSYNSNPLVCADDLYINGVLTTDIEIPNGITAIKSYNFRGWNSLTSIVIPDSVENIHSGAFSECYNLERVTLGTGLKYVDDYAFGDCYNLERVDITDIDKWFEIDFEDLYANPITYAENLYVNDTLYVDHTIEDGTEYIQSYEYYNYSCIQNLYIPKSVILIKSYAFNGSGIENIFFEGTESEWNEVFIASYNDPIEDAKVYFASEEISTDCSVVGHSGGIATCETAPICSRCGKSYGRAYGHDYMSATCTSPEKCWTCGKVLGDYLGHDYTSQGICRHCDSYIESLHDYANSYDDSWHIYRDNTESITVTFSEDTFVEENYDFIYIYDVDDELVGKYTGDELASKSITVKGEQLRIRLKTDRVNNAYGFKIVDIEFECKHSFTIETKDVTCTEDGYVKHTCSLCGEIKYTNKVYAIGHTYSKVEKEPTCTQDGCTEYTCQNCGDVYKENITPSSGVHTYENGNCIYCNKYLESEHNYPVLFDKTWTIYRKGAESVTVTFSKETCVENNYDFIYIYDANDKLVGQYTGNELASKSVTVKGDTLKIRLTSDRISSEYGFKITNIEYTCNHKYKTEIQEATCYQEGYTKHICEKCDDTYLTDEVSLREHSYENGVCTYCGRFLESKHEYENSIDKTWTIHYENASSITLKFAANTYLEDGWDYIYIYGEYGQLIGEYTGDGLSAKSITISGDTAKINFVTDRIGSAYGFKLTDIIVEYNLYDLTGDEKTNLKDLVRMKKILIGTEESSCVSPDLNKDNRTDSLDLTILRKFMLGL